MLWKMAWRNLSRNRRRSIITILAIAFGVASVTLFGGYVASAFSGLSRQAIHGEKLGHLTIAKSGYFEFGEVDQEDYVFSPEELAQVSRIVGADPAVTLVSPRLSVRGLASNGEISTIFIGDAVSRDDLAAIRADYGQRSGELDPANPYGVALAENLARALDLTPGDPGVVFGATLSGQANAVDFDVTDIYNTGNSATNDKFVLMSIELARELLDVEGAERVTVMLDDGGLTDARRDAFETALNAAGMEVEVRTWRDLSSFYKQVRTLFTLIFSFIFAIVVIVALMSVVNTMSMIVLERTREIGTLRALGMGRERVMRLFSFEGLLLAAVGVALGLAILFAVGGAVNAADLSYVPPNSSNRVPLRVEFPPLVIAATAVAVILASVAASTLPARKAARTEIAASLAHS